MSGTAWGRNPSRRGVVRVTTPAGGAVNSAVVLAGEVEPGGSPVETAWGPHPVDPPATGWGAATIGAGLGAAWTRSTTRPAVAGTYFLHVRLTNRPRVRVASAAVVVT